MKWLKSTTNKSYTAQGHTIPGVNSAPLAVDEATYDAITKMAVIKSLVKTGQIIVLEQYTEVAAGTPESILKLQQLSTENAKLADEVTELKSKLATTEEAPSSKELKAAKKAQSEAEAKLEALQAQYDALKAEAEAKIAELTATKEAE